MLSPRLISLLAALALSTPLLSFALPEDNEQAIQITTDEVIRDEKTGQTIYRGNVLYIQGTIEIRADEITFYRVDSEHDKIVAIGSPARMQQQPEPDSAVVHAQGDTIEYYRTEARIHLQDNARVEQDGSLVHGDRIDYFIKDQLIKANSDASDDQRRVRVVIPPHKLEE